MKPDTDKEQRSLWRRPLKGWRGTLGWFAALLAALFVVIASVSWLSQPSVVTVAKLLERSLLLALGVSVLAVLAVAAIRWVCCWRNFRRFLFGVVCLVTLLALFYAVERIRGRLAWNAYVREVESRGETLDFAKFIPPPVREEENFTQCPLLKPIFDFTLHDADHADDYFGGRMEQHDTNGLARLESISVYSAVENHIRSLPSGDVRDELAERKREVESSLSLSNGWLNLASYEAYLRLGTNLNGHTLTDSSASNVLLALVPFETDLAELRKAHAERPLDRWPIHYETNNPYAILLPHLARVKQLCQFLQLSASAKLAAGDTEGALEDMNLAFRVAESVHTEPFLISQIVRVASHRLNTQPLREGLARHQFTDEQLRRLGAQYDSIDILADTALSLRCERACGAITARAVKEHPELFAFINDFRPAGHDADGLERLTACVPSGWYDLNARTLCRLYDAYVLPAVEPSEGRVLPEKLHSLQAALGDLNPVSGAFARYLVMPASDTAIQNTAQGQATINQAIIAIALERYRLANGSYPEKRDLLSPEFLETIPHDVITGKPMIYRLLPDGRYILYSVGWNGKDDSGSASRKGSPNSEDTEDWLWELPDSKLQPY